jgi:hypothetical protein
MARLIVLKCEKDNDLVNLIDSALEDGIGFGIDPEQNTLFTPDLEFITGNIRNISKFLARKTSIYCRWFWWYNIGYMPIWNGGNFKIDVRHSIRPYISRQVNDLTDGMLNYLRQKRSAGVCQVCLGDEFNNNLFPESFQVFIEFGSKQTSLFYKIGESSSEYPINLYSGSPLFSDGLRFWEISGEQELIIRDALKHLLNFSYPYEKSDD